MIHDEPASEFRSRTSAVFLGVAMADALSFPLEDYSRRFLHVVARSLTADYVPHPSGRHALGQFTDDTQMLLAVARAITESRAVQPRTVAEFLIPLFRDLLVVAPDPSTSEAMQALVRGTAECERSGLPEGRAEAGALASVVPIGLWEAARPSRLPEAAASVLRITHNDPRVLGAGAGIAAAIGFHARDEEWILGDFLDCIALAAGVYCPGLAAAVEDFPRLLSQSLGTAWEIAESTLPDPNYPPRPDGLSEYVVPSFLLSIYYFLKSPNDFEAAIGRALRLGGRMTTVVCLTAALSASRLGRDGLPAQLVHSLLSRDEIEEAAREFAAAHEACGLTPRRVDSRQQGALEMGLREDGAP